MKAMILAAGRGERMRPLTDTTPKPLLKVAGKSLLEYHIGALVKAGITELVINHAWLGEKIEAQLRNGAGYGVHIQYSPEAQALETAGGIINALHLLGDEPFIVVNGDIFTDYDFSLLKKTAENLLAEKKASGKIAHLVLVNNPQHNPSGDFYCHDGVVSDPFLTSPFFKRGVEGGGDQQAYTFSGIACYLPEFFSRQSIGSRRSSGSLHSTSSQQPAVKQALAPMLRAAMKKQQVSGEVYPGSWWDIGTPERLKQLDLIQRGV